MLAEPAQAGKRGRGAGRRGAQSPIRLGGAWCRALAAAPWLPGPGNSRGHIFLIFRYRRMSGNDMTARSPKAAAAAAMVIAEIYPSVRIACLLFNS